MKSFFSDSSVDRSNSVEEDEISSMQKYHINFGDDESSSESESNESVIPCARNRMRRNEDNDGMLLRLRKSVLIVVCKMIVEPFCLDDVYYC